MEIYERVDKEDLSWLLYSGDHIQRYIYFKDFYKEKNILDAACGSGYGCEIMIKNYAKRVVGIDINDAIIRKNIKTYQYPNLEFLNIPCENINQLESKFDIITSFETIEHLKEPKVFIQYAYDLLVDNGILIISTPNVKRFKESNQSNIQNHYHLHEFSLDELKDILMNCHFKIKTIYHQSESIEFLRYMEIQHNFHQFRQIVKSSIAFRIESIIRKILCKPYRPIPFFYPYCHKQTINDFVIEELNKPEDWYKTFIIIAQK